MIINDHAMKKYPIFAEKYRIYKNIPPNVPPQKVSDMTDITVSLWKCHSSGQQSIWLRKSLFQTIFLFTLVLRPIHTAQTNANKLQQTSWLKLAVGFRIFWKITVMFTLHQQTPTNSISISMFSRVKTNSNQHQPTPTGVTHWSNKLQQTSLLEFVGVCLCGVNWP